MPEPKQWKKFGDKKYQLIKYEQKKQWAYNARDNLKRRGYMVRIVPGKLRGKTIYYVYSRGK